MSTNANILSELETRQLVHDCTDRPQLEAHLLSAPRSVYCGFDPTADSLHIGNLVQLLALRRFQLAGHRPIALVGGATGLIGDPSGKLGERTLDDPATVAARAERIRRQIETILDVSGGALLVDNLEWLGTLDLLTFLRAFGKHFSVGTMLGKESVRTRLAGGLSFTEFSYMILQGIDFVELRRRFDCTLQIGGSDQWGNITSGIDLVRRVDNATVFGLTIPLLTQSDGKKLGKTEAGAVWLDAELTSPFSLYQYCINAADDDLPMLLRTLTLLPSTVLEKVVTEHSVHPERRAAQRVLAREVTTLVHGAQAFARAERITEALFDGSVAELDGSDLHELAASMPMWAVTRTALAAMTLADVLVATGLAASKSQARELCRGGGVRLFDELVLDPQTGRLDEKARFGEFLVVQRGAKSHALVRIES